MQQLRELKTILGQAFFIQHPNQEIRTADGIILLKQMEVKTFLVFFYCVFGKMLFCWKHFFSFLFEVEEFLSHAADLRSKIEIHQQLGGTN
jgi:hypothetical protein